MYHGGRTYRHAIFSVFGVFAAGVRWKLWLLKEALTAVHITRNSLTGAVCDSWVSWLVMAHSCRMADGGGGGDGSSGEDSSWRFGVSA